MPTHTASRRNQERPMRRCWLAIVAGSLLGAGLFAQAPAQPQTPAPPQAPALDPKNPLDYSLMEWEKAMGGLQSFVAEVNRTTLDKTFGSVEASAGWAKYVKGQAGQAG